MRQRRGEGRPEWVVVGISPADLWNFPFLAVSLLSRLSFFVFCFSEVEAARNILLVSSHERASTLASAGATEVYRKSLTEKAGMKSISVRHYAVGSGP